MSGSVPSVTNEEESTTLAAAAPVTAVATDRSEESVGQEEELQKLSGVASLIRGSMSEELMDADVEEELTDEERIENVEVPSHSNSKEVLHPMDSMTSSCPSASAVDTEGATVRTQRKRYTQEFEGDELDGVDEVEELRPVEAEYLGGSHVGIGGSESPGFRGSLMSGAPLSWGTQVF